MQSASQLTAVIHRHRMKAAYLGSASSWPFIQVAANFLFRPTYLKPRD